MKKILVLVIFFTTFLSYAQAEKSNEIRLNAFSVIASRNLDLSYEYLFNEESAVGVSFAFDLTGGEKYNLFGINQKYAVTPYYRYYFPENVINGFFLEAFLSANGGKNKEEIEGLSEDIELTDEDEIIDEEYVGLEYADFAFGLGGGFKYISDSGFVGEIFGGVGRNLSGDERAPVVVPRLGVSFGFRF